MAISKRVISLERMALIINSIDNVATALRNLDAVSKIVLEIGNGYHEVVLKDSVPFGHKFAIVDIARGSDVIKYGESIGEAVTDIYVGEHVHVQNLASKRG